MATNTKRDPKVDPQRGAAIYCKTGDKPKTAEQFRLVTARRGDNIDYVNWAGKVHTCWITTWKRWCAEQDIERIVNGDDAV